LNNPDEIAEAIEKLENLVGGITNLLNYIRENYKKDIVTSKSGLSLTVIK